MHLTHDINEVNELTTPKEFNGTTPYDDVSAVKIQIEAMKKLVENHKGWMEVAYSPEDARRILRQNKMVVVLGIEVDNLGGMKHEDRITGT